MRWVDIKAIWQGHGCWGPMDKYWFAIGCETSLVGVDVKRKGLLGRVSIVLCKSTYAGRLTCCG
jgi:hypothetical protein